MPARDISLRFLFLSGCRNILIAFAGCIYNINIVSARYYLFT